MADIPDWLVQFYSSGDRINPKKALSGGYPLPFQAMLMPLLESALEQNWPCILPSSKEHLWFYAFAADDRTLRELRWMLQAFLGSADTFPDLPIITASSDPAEQILLQQAPSGIIKFRLLEPLKDCPHVKERVFRSLARLIKLVRQRPQLTSTVRRPVGRILRDFFTACHINDGNSAMLFLTELKGNGSLSQRNLLFLELQALGACQQWAEILAHESLPDILAGRVPCRLNRLLLRTLGHKLLNRIQFEDFPADSLEEAKYLCHGVLPLFNVTPSLENHPSFEEDWKLWAIGSASLGYNPWTLLPAFVDESWKQTVKAWAGLESSYITEAKEPLQNTESSEVAENNLNQMDIPVRVLTVENVINLLQRVLLATPNEQVEIYEILLGMPTETENLIAKDTFTFTLWQTLKNKFDEKNYGWRDWFAELKEGIIDPEQLQQKVSNFSSQWSVESFDTFLLTQLLESECSDTVSGVLRNSLPLLLSWLEDARVVCPNELWIAWLELLALDSIVSEQDIRLAEVILNKLLSDNFSVETYKRAIQAIEIVLDKSSSVRAFSYSLDLVDQLLDASCPDPLLIEQLWGQILSNALKRWKRLDLDQKTLVKVIATEIQGERAPEQFPIEEVEESVGTSPYLDMSGKYLAIYSLTEGAARRAMHVIGSLFPSLVIELNHDHVATPALKKMASRADFFVFAWGSSKHQAFYAITQIKQDLIYPNGKGSSSIVRAFLNAIHP
ncbi:protein DpdD [Shewanella algae]|uniref:protein DpdD n=1 Tax=Shewanella algae TaxID=38313 RepID=UPI00118318CC|nr:protein DpdD [Shewanella algae]MBO2643877.1 hypothetical protein [Shewanella algae]QTE95372.1 hypothetical protein JKK45_02025 [Shewanella algae]TVL50790.1 hypothetical protein AYI98_07620 [Shewanella algae]